MNKHALATRPDPAVCPNIGLAYIAGTLLQAGYEVIFLDAESDGLTIEEFGEQVFHHNPDLVGFTCFTKDVPNLVATTSYLKSRFPELILVAGGNHPSALPLETMQEIIDLDFVVHGEGEIALIALLNAIKRNLDLNLVNGISFRENNKIRITQPPDPIRDLDTLPFPNFDGLNFKNYRRLLRLKPNSLLPVATTRGCPFKCKYCFRLFGNITRQRSADGVMDELLFQSKRYGKTNILFTDETFTLNKNRSSLLCEKILKSDLSKTLRWVCGTRADLVDANLLKLMQHAGCRYLYFGIESSDEQTLDAISKKITIEQVKRAVTFAKEAKIKTVTCYIFGHPGETEQQVRRTINFALRTNPTYASFNIMVPLPGTEIREMAQRGEAGYILKSHDWLDYGMIGGSALESKELSSKKLNQLQQLAMLKFYMRPSKFFRLFEFISIFRLAKYAVSLLFKKPSSP